MASEAEDFILRLNQNLAAEAQVAKGALVQLEVQMATTKAASAQLGNAMNATGAQMASIKPPPAGGADKLKTLAVAADKTSKAAGNAGIDIDKMGKALGKLGGPAGSAAAQFGDIGEAVGKLRDMGAAGMFAGIAVAVVAVVAALAAGAAAITRWAIGLADTARNAVLAVAGIENSSEALRGLHSILPAVHSATGLATAEIQKMAVELADANVPADRLHASLQALATAKAGGATEKFVADLKKELIATGKVPPQLAAQMSEFERIAKAKMISLDSQGGRLKENIGRLFGGLKIEPFLQGLTKLVALLDENTASGRALQFLFQRLFQPLVDGATRAIPAIERAFIVLLTWAVKGYIALVRFFRSPGGDELRAKVQSVREVFGALGAIIDAASAQVRKFITWMNGTSTGARVVKTVLGAAFSYLMGPITAAQNAVKAFGAAVVFIGNLIASPRAALEGAWNAITTAVSAAVDSAMASAGQLGSAITGALGKAVDGVGAFVAGFFAIGSNMVIAIANGIKAAAFAVIGAITGVVGGAIAQAKAILHIKSPSRVFANIGAQTGAGMAEGVEASAPDAQEAMENMVSPPTGSAGARGKRAGKGGGASFVFNNCVFGGDWNEEKARAMLTKLWHEASLDAETAPLDPAGA